jgi:hypothetical protein
VYFQPSELRPVAKTTRKLLCDGFHTRYFKRYTDRNAIRTCSYVFEMQLALHPDFNDLDDSLKPVVILSNQQYGDHNDADSHEAIYNTVRQTIDDKLIELMKTVGLPQPHTRQEQPPPIEQEQDENLTMFGRRRHRVPATTPHTADLDQQIRAELASWTADATALLRDAKGRALETVTEYWGRQAARRAQVEAAGRQVEVATYPWLPLVAREVYSVPSTSALIERDFGMAGRLLTPERSQADAANVDMGAFVNANRQFVDLTQCMKIDEDERADHIPGNVCVSMDLLQTKTMTSTIRDHRPRFTRIRRSTTARTARKTTKLENATVSTIRRWILNTQAHEYIPHRFMLAVY